MTIFLAPDIMIKYVKSICFMGLKKGFLGGAVVENPLPMQETWVWSLDWEDSPGEGNHNPLQYFCLVNSTDKEPGGLGGVAKSRTQPSDWAWRMRTHTQTQRGSHKMTLFLAANAKLMKETAEPKLVTSVLPRSSRWSGRWQSGLKALVPYSCRFTRTAPLESRVGGGGREMIQLMISGQTTL